MHSEDALEQCDGVLAGKYTIGFGQKYVVLPHDEGALRSITMHPSPLPSRDIQETRVWHRSCFVNVTEPPL